MGVLIEISSSEAKGTDPVGISWKSYCKCSSRRVIESQKRVNGRDASKQRRLAAVGQRHASVVLNFWPASSDLASFATLARNIAACDAAIVHLCVSATAWDAGVPGAPGGEGKIESHGWSIDRDLESDIPLGSLADPLRADALGFPFHVSFPLYSGEACVGALAITSRQVRSLSDQLLETIKGVARLIERDVELRCAASRAVRLAEGGNFIARS